MILELIVTTSMALISQAEVTTDVAPDMRPEIKVEKKIIYEKNQVVDLSGSTVEGENQNPPAFFVTKMQTPDAKSLLQDRLDALKLRDFNLMGF